MLRHLLCKMSNPIRPFRPGHENVLPLCYQLALNNNLSQPQAFFSQSSNSAAKPNAQTIEENPYFAKYADKIKKAQAAKQPLNFGEDLKKKTTVNESCPQINCSELPEPSRVDKPIPKVTKLESGTQDIKGNY